MMYIMCEELFKIDLTWDHDRKVTQKERRNISNVYDSI